MSLAWPSVFTAERESAYIGCSGSMASFTPAAWHSGRRAAMPSVICLRDSTSDWPGTAPQTRTMSGAPDGDAFDAGGRELRGGSLNRPRFRGDRVDAEAI